MCKGWIKLHRSLKDWEWYSDINATRLLTHLLISVNYTDKKWKGRLIKAGSMAFSWDTLGSELGLTRQQLRTAMSKLESSKEVTRKLTGSYQLVTLCKWEELQDTNNEVTAKTTPNQQKNNREITPTKEGKKEKKEISKAFATEQDFINGFNLAKGIATGTKGKARIMSATDKNNFKRLNEAYTKADFNHAIKMMSKDEWVKETDNFNMTHFLRNNNFNKFINQTDTLPMAQGLREGN